MLLLLPTQKKSELARGKREREDLITERIASPLLNGFRFHFADGGSDKHAREHNCKSERGERTRDCLRNSFHRPVEHLSSGETMALLLSHFSLNCERSRDDLSTSTVMRNLSSGLIISYWLCAVNFSSPASIIVIIEMFFVVQLLMVRSRCI